MAQYGASAPAVVALPAEIDMTNADQVYDCLDTAARSGAPMVIADFAAPAFCDAAGVRRLLTLHARAAAHGVQLRLVIPPGGMLRRMLVLLEADHLLPVYASVREATVPWPPPKQDPLSGPDGGRPGYAP